MSNSRFTVRQLTTAAVIAAVYTVLTTLLPIPQYGAIQLRVAEAMTVLPFFFPEAIPGLAVGFVFIGLGLWLIKGGKKKRPAEPDYTEFKGEGEV